MSSCSLLPMYVFLHGLYSGIYSPSDLNRDRVFLFFFVHSALESGVLRYASRSAITQTMTVSCSVRDAASGEKWLSHLRSLSTLILAKSINESRNLTLLDNGNRTSGRKLLWRLSFQDFLPPFLLPKL